MLRSILVGLDGSAHSQSALELGIRWARRFDALLVGLGIIDEPGLHGSEEVLFGEAYFRKINEGLLTETRHHVERLLGQCAVRCAEANVAFKPLEDVGTPHEQILAEAQRYDLILLGRQTHFQFGSEDVPDHTLSRVLGPAPRPVVVVPEHLGPGEAVVIAYDGSLQAARALYAFQNAGLGYGQKVHVLSVASERLEAARHADRAVEFLRSHDLKAEPHPITSETTPAQAILEQLRPLDAGLLVMGAFGQPVLREFFFGSVTRTLLDQSPVPLFLFH